MMKMYDDVSKLLINFDKFRGFFDGSSQEGLSLYGDGAILCSGCSRVHKLLMNCGLGSESKGELMALWMLLFFVKILNLDGL